MIKADAVRSQPMVMALDTVDHLAAHGLTIAEASSLDAARALVKAIVADVDQAIVQHFNAHDAAGQNPYRDTIALGSRTVAFATEVELFPDGDLPRRFDLAFEGAPRPRAERLAEKVIADVTALLREHDFEVVTHLRHGDGTLRSIVIRDPVYVERATKAREASRASAVAVMSTPTGTSATLDPRALGISSVTSADLIGIAKAHIDSVIDSCERKLFDHLAVLQSAGVSPFESTATRSIDRYNISAVVAGMGRWRGDFCYIEAPCSTPVLTRQRLDATLKDAFATDDITFDIQKAQRYVLNELFTRLKANASLPLAAMVWEDRNNDMDLSVVLTGKPPPPPKPPLVQRLLALVSPKKPAPLALPASSDVPPALPAPTVVPTAVAAAPYAIAQAKS